MKQDRALIVINGELPQKNLLEQLGKQVGLIICTDGAVNQINQKGVNPDVIIGDLDSIEPALRKSYEEKNKIIEKPCQYSTDFEKALALAKEREIKQVDLVGIKGGRFDHAFTNLSILYNHRYWFEYQIFDDQGVGHLMHEKNAKLSYHAAVGSIVSLLPFEKVEGITTSGLLYPLNDESLEFGGRSGLSNQTVADQFEISLKKGAMLVYCLT